MFVVIYFLRDCVILLTGTESVQVLSKALVVVPYETLPGEIRWFVVPYDILLGCTGRGTA
jgi:hypothetical protein